MSFKDKVSNSLSLRQSLLAKRTSMICSVISGPKVSVPTGIAPSSKRSGVSAVEPSIAYLRTTVPSKPPPRITLKYATFPSPCSSPSYKDVEDDKVAVPESPAGTMPTLKVEGTMGPTMALLTKVSMWVTMVAAAAIALAEGASIKSLRSGNKSPWTTLWTETIFLNSTVASRAVSSVSTLTA